MTIATLQSPRTTFSFELGQDGVAVVAIDIPGRPMNVFTPNFIAELGALAEEVASRDDIVGLVIASGKPGAFLAGADLKDFVTVFERGMTPKQAADSTAQANRVLRSLERCGKPVAAAINGLALGGGYELCLACHHRVLVDDPKAFVGLPEVTVGLLPGGGGTQRLPRLIGVAAALPLLVSGRHVKAAEALSLGMVDEVVPVGLAVEAARRWVSGRRAAGWAAVQPWDVKGFVLPGGSGAMAPHAAATFGNGLASMRRDTHDNYPAPLAILQCVYEGSQLPFDKAMAVEARYFGGLLAGVVARNLMRTLFVGKGAAARRHRPAGIERRTVKRLALVGDTAGLQTVAERARAASLEVADLPSGEAVGRNDFDLVLVASREGGVDADVDMDAIRAVMPPLGAHGPVIEFIVGASTPPRSTAAAIELACQLRATPIVVRGQSVLQRLIGAYRDEGAALRREGVGPALIENVARQAGFTHGPLSAAIRGDAADAPGVATNVAASAGALPADTPAPSAALGKLEQRSTPSTAVASSAADVRQRLLYSQALEAMRCHDDGLVTHPIDADLLGVLGAGYPSWTGGPLSYIETIGLPAFVESCDRLSVSHGERFRPSVALRRRALDGFGFHRPSGE